MPPLRSCGAIRNPQISNRQSVAGQRCKQSTYLLIDPPAAELPGEQVHAMWSKINKCKMTVSSAVRSISAAATTTTNK